MDLDTTSLLASAHGKCLRILTGVLKEDFVGLSAAARAARRQHVICNRTSKRIVRLDEAFAVARHLTMMRVDKFVDELKEETGSKCSKDAVPATADVSSTLARLDADIEDFKAGAPSCGELPPSERAKPDAVGSSLDYLQILEDNLKEVFKKFRGLNSTTWPPIAGQAEEETFAFITTSAEEWIHTMKEKGMTVEQKKAARAHVADRCTAGLAAWKSFVLQCEAERQASAPAPTCVAPSRPKLKGVTKRR